MDFGAFYCIKTIGLSYSDGKCKCLMEKNRYKVFYGRKLKGTSVFWLIWCFVMALFLGLIALNLFHNNNADIDFNRGYNSGYQQGMIDSDLKWRDRIQHRIDSLLHPQLDTFKLIESDTTMISDTLRGS